MRAGALALGLLGLGSAGCRVLAPVDDYLSYRAYRYEAAGPERMTAGATYLQQFPQGRFHREVSEAVLGQEEDYWAEHRTSAEGLGLYLQAFPQGAHAGEARVRLEQFEQRRQQAEAERRAREAEEAARNADALRARQEAARYFARQLFARWLRMYGGLDGWGRPVPALAEANPAFSAAFQEEPPPQCRGVHCRKNYRSEFSVAVPGRTAATRAVMLTLDLVRQGPERNVVQGLVTVHNRGLTQWWESEHQQLVEADNADGREAAVRWAMDALRAAFVAAFPDGRETPAALYGPPPEAVMEGVEDDENTPAAPTDPSQCVIPSQPLGVRWSAVVGCPGVTGGVLGAPDEAEAEHGAHGGVPLEAVTAHACLRFDAYAALDGEGMSTDEGLMVSLLPPCAYQTAPTPPGRPGVRRPPGRPPVRPAARPAAPAARPATP